MINQNNLVFIVSLPRSGSTLLQAILSNNSRVGTTSEPWLLLPFLSIFRPDLISSTYNQSLANLAIDDFLRKTSGIEDYQSELRGFILRLYNKPRHYDFIIDKTPRYYEILYEITTFFPDSKIIVLKRDPIHVFASILKTWKFSSIEHFASSHGRDLLEGPKIIQSFLDNNPANPNIREIQYHDLITNPDALIKDLCNWIGLTYSKEMLDYSRNTQYTGLFGDQTGINESKINESIKNLQDYNLSKSEMSLIGGYGQFLGKDFLRSYGTPGIHDEKQQFSFKYYTFFYYRFVKRKEITLKALVKKELGKRRLIINKNFYFR